MPAPGSIPVNSGLPFPRTTRAIQAARLDNVDGSPESPGFCGEGTVGDWLDAQDGPPPEGEGPSERVGQWLWPWSSSSSAGFSTTEVSVVSSRPAIEAAFASAERVTLTGSMTPAAIRSMYSPVAAL